MYDGAAFERDFGDGMVGVVWPMTFGKGRLCIGPAGSGAYDRGYCYDSPRFAASALAAMGDSSTEPLGWFRNLQTGQYQPEYTHQRIDPGEVDLAPSSVYFDRGDAAGAARAG